MRIRENTATSPDAATYLATFYYQPGGEPEALLRGSTSPAAYAYTTYGQDALGRLTGLNHALAGGANLNVSATFAYNPASQVAAQTRDNDAYAWTGHYAVARAYTTNGLTSTARPAAPRSATMPTATSRATAPTPLPTMSRTG